MPIFLVSGLIIAIFGSLLTKYADQLADITGMGEALMGAIFLGGSTSLSGITTSVTAAALNHPELAISNAVGGIAAQTVFLAIADIFYRKINLEHAAASQANIMQGGLLVGLLAIPLLAMATPKWAFFSIHPLSILLIIFYVFGLRLISKAKDDPMWKPRKTKETRLDKKEYSETKLTNIILIWGKFFVFVIIIGFAGYFVAKSGVVISKEAGISETVVGGIFTSITTSLPELVTSIAAVRQGALTLAVGGIIGGNCFDVLFVSFSDFAYRKGSIYDALSLFQIFILSLTIILTSILLLGLLRREKHGIANIGFESFMIILIYIIGFSYLAFSA